jgi:DNA-binding MarR family transcriptional regulator
MARKENSSAVRKSARTADPAALLLEAFLPYRLSVLTNTISTSIARHYESAFRLTVAEWRVMATLARFPRVSAGEIVELTAMDKVAISRAVSQLLRSGRLLRKFDAADRRRSILQLSAAGREVYRRVAPLARLYEDQLLQALDPGERSAFSRALGKLMQRAASLDHPTSA